MGFYIFFLFFSIVNGVKLKEKNEIINYRWGRAEIPLPLGTSKTHYPLQIKIQVRHWSPFLSDAEDLSVPLLELHPVHFDFWPGGSTWYHPWSELQNTPQISVLGAWVSTASSLSSLPPAVCNSATIPVPIAGLKDYLFDLPCSSLSKLLILLFC